MYLFKSNNNILLLAQWLKLCASNVEGTRLIPAYCVAKSEIKNLDPPANSDSHTHTYHSNMDFNMDYSVSSLFHSGYTFQGLAKCLGWHLNKNQAMSGAGNSPGLLICVFPPLILFIFGCAGLHQLSSSCSKRGLLLLGSMGFRVLGLQ